MHLTLQNIQQAVKGSGIKDVSHSILQVLLSLGSSPLYLTFLSSISSEFTHNNNNKIKQAVVKGFILLFFFSNSL